LERPFCLNHLITGVVENGEEHGGGVDEGLREDPAVDGKHDGRQEGEVAQDEEQRLGKKIGLEYKVQSFEHFFKAEAL
jgi:hypothetical protein